MPVISTIAAATARAFGAFKAAAGGAADEFFNYVTLLLHGDGTNGAQNNTFLDSSTNNFTITRNGNTTQGTFSPFSQDDGKWGAYFDGSGDYISVPDSADFTMGSGDFTVQCWVFSTANSASDQYILGQVTSGGQAANTSFQLYKKATTNVAEAYVYAGSGKVATASAVIPVGVWTHLAMVRDGGTLRLYVNGVQDGTNATLSTTAITDSGGSFAVGRTGDYNGLYYSGYVANVSVVKGTCLFPNGTTFTPSTTPLSKSTSGQSVLLCYANRFIDSNTATTAKTVTVGGNTSIQPFSPFAPSAAYSAATNGGSGYFDGSGDYLAVANSSLLDLASTFSLEFWIYRINGNNQIWISRGGGAGSWSTSNGLQYHCFIESSTFYFQYNGGGSPVTLFSTATLPALNAWTHIAVARNGTTTRGWVNGISLGTSTTAPVAPATTNLTRLGTGVQVDYPFAGYMAGVRLLQGSAAYDASSSTITVPTAPPTAITNTSLLCNFTNAGIIDNTGRNVIETVGNAQVSTSIVKYGTGSLAFDGTGDYLAARMTPEVVFGSGDMTIECWVYANTISGIDTIFDTRTSGSFGNESFLFQLNAGVPQVWAGSYSGASPVAEGSAAISTSTWTHIAFTRASGTNRLFVNGTSVASNSNSWTQTLVTSNPYYIGQTVGVDRPFDGYIDDLRITKGVARYTANFTPPTAAFPDL